MKELSLNEFYAHSLELKAPWKVEVTIDGESWQVRLLVECARATGLTPLAKATDQIEKNAEGIMNYLMHPITNAAAEGINSGIQNLKHVLFLFGKLVISPAQFPAHSRGTFDK